MKVPFVTVNTGHIKIISAEDDIAYPYALAVVQDSYPDARACRSGRAGLDGRAPGGD